MSNNYDVEFTSSSKDIDDVDDDLGLKTEAHSKPTMEMDENGNIITEVNGNRVKVRPSVMFTRPNVPISDGRPQRQEHYSSEDRTMVHDAEIEDEDIPSESSSGSSSSQLSSLATTSSSLRQRTFSSKESSSSSSLSSSTLTSTGLTPSTAKTMKSVGAALEMYARRDKSVNREADAKTEDILHAMRDDALQSLRSNRIRNDIASGLLRRSSNTSSSIGSITNSSGSSSNSGNNPTNTQPNLTKRLMNFLSPPIDPKASTFMRITKRISRAFIFLIISFILTIIMVRLSSSSFDKLSIDDVQWYVSI